MAQGSIGASAAVDRSEGFGERLLGTLIERAHEMPPQLIAPLVAEVIAEIGGRDVAVFLQDYDQMTLVPLPGKGLVVGKPEPIDGSFAGRAFLGDEMVEQEVIWRRAVVRAAVGRHGPGRSFGVHCPEPG